MLLEDPVALPQIVPGAETLVGHSALTVVAVRRYRDRGAIVAFEGITDREAAEELRGSVLSIAERPELDDRAWWREDLVGLRAVDGAGATLGDVVDVVVGVSQDRLVVETASGSRVEVPFVDALVDDPSGSDIVIRPPEGLFPDG